MKRILLLIISLWFYCLTNAQIIDVYVGIYKNGCYSMGTSEGWKRVEINGFPDFYRKGYLNFKNDNITLVIGATSAEKEIYKSLSFRYGNNHRRTLIMSEIVHDEFNMHDKDDNQVTIYYFGSEMFENGKSMFIVSDLRLKTMYFLIPANNIDSIMSTLYK